MRNNKCRRARSATRRMTPTCEPNRNPARRRRVRPWWRVRGNRSSMEVETLRHGEVNLCFRVENIPLNPTRC